MKAVFLETAKRVSIKEVANPIRGEDEVLIKVRAASICGSDTAAYKGSNTMGIFPRILGHEIAGEVLEIPEGNNTGIKVGDRVVIEPYIYCGTCYPCSIGRTNSCLNLSVIGVFADGGMSEYYTHPIKMVHKAPDIVPWECLAMSEPLTIALHAIHRAGLKKGEHVVITGAGPIGILIALAALTYGATPILIDIIDQRLQIANDLGVKNTINSTKEDAVQRISEITNGRLAEVVIEASGAEEVIKNTINFVVHTGRVVFVGWPKSKEIPFSTYWMTRKELDIRGSKNSAGEFPEAIELIADKKVNVAPLISKKITIDETPQVLKDLVDYPNRFLKMCILL